MSKLPRILVSGHSHLGDRERNEDSWGIYQFPLASPRRGRPPQVGMLAVIADGLGGEANGQAGSMAALRVCSTVNLPSLLQTCQDREQVLHQVFRAAHDAVTRSGGYTTIVMMLHLPGEPIYIAWAGDSACWWWEPRKGWKRLTPPHGWGNRLDNFLGCRRDAHVTGGAVMAYLEAAKSGVYMLTSDGMDPLLEGGKGSDLAVTRDTPASVAVINAVDFTRKVAGRSSDNTTAIRLETR